MESATVPSSQTEAIKERIVTSTPYWAENFAFIVDKRGRKIPLVGKPGQLALDGEMEAQAAAGDPIRAIVLKARQLGFSTWIQGKLCHRCTLRERYDAVTVAHDKETGGKLFRMFETMWGNLPKEEWLKPEASSYRRSQFLHLANHGWQEGDLFPDSRYTVDTAGEFQAGRGGTYRAVHASEVAFWPQIGEKLTSLMSAVPDDPETMFVMESTANGFNEFKDWWDDAYEGRSDWIAFFWPWWKDDEYSRPFASETERERFIVGDPSNPYAEEEPDLVKNFGLELEQLHWRRQTIVNKGGGDLRKFHQEYPSTAEEAFITTGQKVFDGFRISQLLVEVDISDPKVPSEERPGPALGDLTAAESSTVASRTGGEVEVPTKALWTPRLAGMENPTSPVRLWLPKDDLGQPQRPSEYIVFVDPSGGEMEGRVEPDYHAIEVIDHKTGDQVAEYRSRIDPDEIAKLAMLLALFFKMAWVGVERTGGWGLPILRILYLDYHYPFVYKSKHVGNSNEKPKQQLGFSTDVRTKPLLVAGMMELLRIEKTGIRSRVLANEARTYTRTDTGKLQAESGKYDDCLMAYMGAQHLAHELPLKGLDQAASEQTGGFQAPIGVRSYDPRY